MYSAPSSPSLVPPLLTLPPRPSPPRPPSSPSLTPPRRFRCSTWRATTSCSRVPHGWRSTAIPRRRACGRLTSPPSHPTSAFAATLGTLPWLALISHSASISLISFISFNQLLAPAPDHAHAHIRLPLLSTLFSARNPPTLLPSPSPPSPSASLQLRRPAKGEAWSRHRPDLARRTTHTLHHVDQGRSRCALCFARMRLARTCPPGAPSPLTPLYLPLTPYPYSPPGARTQDGQGSAGRGARGDGRRP